MIERHEEENVVNDEPRSRSDEWTALLLAAGTGDRQAFDRLVELAKPAIHRRAMSRLQDAVLADEVVIRTFTRLWRHRASYDASRANAGTWLYRIVDRLITDACRTRKRQRKRQVAGFDTLSPGNEDGELVRVEPEDDVELPPTAEADLPLVARLVREGLARLSKQDSEILRLYYFEQLDYEQIGQRLGKSANAVGTQLTRARQKLLERLPPEALA